MQTIARAGLLACAFLAIGHGAQAGCASGDIAGQWKMVGSAAYAGSESAVWCSVKLVNGTVASRYTISGSCQNQNPSQGVPTSFALSGSNTIAEAASCDVTGSFTIIQSPPQPSLAATILSAHVQNVGANKTLIVGLARYPNIQQQGTVVLLNFTMVR